MSRSSAILSGLRLLAVSAAATLLFGCGTGPVAPPQSSERAGPPILSVADDGSATFRSGDALEFALDQASGSRALRVTKQVGPEGGWVQCGRFLLVLPAGAIDATATVTMTMRDSTAMLVDLEISPPQLNNFKEPVVLSCNTTGTTAEADSLNMYWFDPSADTWVGMSCEKDMAATKYCLDSVAANDVTAPDLTAGNVTGLSTQLSHFSRYSAGKAGW